MKFRQLHSWDLTAEEAVALQRQLASRVDTTTPVAGWELVAGADISYNRFSDTLYAGVVVLRAEDWSVVERVGVTTEATFPYRPGLLSFREAPAVLEAFARLQAEPDVIMLDGQGLAHPRRLGLACHLGLWLDRPCVGCAKSLLVGTFEPPAREAGATTPLVHRGDVVGRVVRTKTGVNPVFVSPGHRIDLDSAVRLVLGSCKGYRVPEPTRQAHLHVNALRQAASG